MIFFFFLVSKTMPYTYSVYVGNLPITVSTNQLKTLFSQCGEVLHVWVNQSFNKITYGFVEFTDFICAEKACTKFNSVSIDLSQIIVRLSDQTKQKLQLK